MKKKILAVLAVIIAAAALFGFHSHYETEKHRQEVQQEIKKLTFNTDIRLGSTGMNDEQMLQFLKARAKYDKHSNSYAHAKIISLWQELPDSAGTIRFRYRAFEDYGYYNIYTAEVSSTHATVKLYKSKYEVEEAARRKSEEEQSSRDLPQTPTDDELSELRNSDDMKYRNE